MKTIRKNEHFDPADCPYEVLGLFEQYLDLERSRVLGTRRLDCDEAPRPLGSDGMHERLLTAPLKLQRGHKDVTVKASEDRPVRVLVLTHILCGRLVRRRPD